MRGQCCCKYLCPKLSSLKSWLYSSSIVWNQGVFLNTLYRRTPLLFPADMTSENTLFLFYSFLTKLSKTTTLTKEPKVTMGICMSKSLREIIDTIRGDVPRSVYISKILEKNCKGNEQEKTTCNPKCDQWGLSRNQPREDPIDLSVRPPRNG